MKKREKTYKMLKRSFISLLLVFALAAGGCTKAGAPDASRLAEGENVRVSFDAFLDEIFVSDLQDNILNLHYTVANPGDYGIEEYSLKLGDYSEESYRQSVEEVKETYEQLKEFSYTDLSEEQQTTYDILEEYLDMQIKGEEYYFYEEPLSPNSGVQSQLPQLLAEYIFRTDSDVEDYLGLLGNIPEYFESLMDFERRKADKGLFMSDEVLEDVISQCESFIENPEINLLVTSFAERMDDYQAEDEQKNKWTEENKKIVLETIIPTYRHLVEELETLKGSGKNDGGLCNFEKGKDYYEYLLQYYIGSEKSVEEMADMIEEAEEEAINSMVGLLTKEPELYLEFGNETLSVENPEEMLEDLRKKIAADYPEGGSETYEIKYVDESLEEYTSPAFYLTPAIDDIESNVIYINRSSQAEGVKLYTTLAHEGYPGHLYQETYYKSSNPHPVRSLLYYGGYTEGWGIYAENYGYQYMDLSENEKKLQQSNFIATLCLYSKIDLGIHFEGWTLEETAEFLEENGIKDEEATKEVYNYVVAEPGNYLKYFVGYLEILELKKDYKKMAADGYTEKAFHTFFLEEGPMSFTLLHKRLGILSAKEK